LILSDYMMDNVDGISLGKILSNSDKFGHIPLILLTADTTTDTKLKALKIGVIDILYKPFSFNELQQKIETVLNTLEKQKIAFFASHGICKEMSQEPVIDQKHIKDLFGLTERELVIIDYLKEGYTYEQIGELLFISG